MTKEEKETDVRQVSSDVILLNEIRGKMKLIHGDCLKEMFDIPDNSVDMVCCDMPFGV